MNSKHKKLLHTTDLLYRADTAFLSVYSIVAKYFSVFTHTIRDTGVDVFMSGSMGEGCMIPRYMTTGEYESDYMTSLPLLDGHVIADVPGKLGYVYIRYTDTQTEEVTYVSPYTMRDEMQKFWPATGMESLMRGFCNTLTSQTLDYSADSHVTNASFETDFDIPGLCYHSFDHVCAYHVSEWPPIAAEWVSRPRKWPSPSDICRISHKGCHCVPKSSPGGDIHKEWRYSFSKPELEIVKLQSEQQRRVYLWFKLIFYTFIKRKSYDNVQFTEIRKDTTSERLADMLRYDFSTSEPHQREKDISETSTDEDTDNKQANQHNLHSYSIKTTFMWYCEQHPPADKIWDDDNIERALKGLLGTYLLFLECGSIPNYFIRHQNIIDNVSADSLQEGIVRMKLILDNWQNIMADMITTVDQCIADDELSGMEESARLTDEISPLILTQLISMLPQIFQSFYGSSYPAIGDPDVD